MRLKELFVSALYKTGFLPPIEASYEQWETAHDSGDANHVRMIKPHQP